MTIIFNYSSEGVTIKGDAEIMHKAALGNGNLEPALLDISNLRVDAQTLATLYSQAEFSGPVYDNYDELAGFPKAKQYAALKAKFESRIEAQ
ncbi:hypothetical protein [Lysinibacillus sp.]|uniref:hypothetical protein n=1 Tax=Lysinibacillus sp. TaxID=1869345 RepID=UPI0028A0B772|nr:hypothetical protein [Lysinibacillus sp.]